jgi:5-methyltetrahydropteroyltriglutamate--homocysteine methyltransferase
LLLPSFIAQALGSGRENVIQAIADSAVAAGRREVSEKAHDPAVAARLSAVASDMGKRNSSFAARNALQRRRFNLPPFPTTTIGSFPQTAEVRKARAAHAKGGLSDVQYEQFLRKETERTIRWQE